MSLKGPVDIYRIGLAEYESLIQTRESLQKEKAHPSTVTGWDVNIAVFKIPSYKDEKYKKDHTTSFAFTRKIPTDKGNINCDILFSELPPRNKKKRYGLMFRTSCKDCEKIRYLALKENMDSNVVWKMMVIGTEKLIGHWNPETMRFDKEMNN